jgi:tetratricopeptide (TPR) repeat protein
MPPSPLPTSSPDALRSFVAGREQLRSYLTTGSGELLCQAKRSFSAAAAFDPRFQLAIFYRSLVQAELRETGAAIDGFEQLLKAQTDLRAEVLLQLAYAHTKRYRNEDFVKAEGYLAEASQAAQARGEKGSELLALGESLKVFLYAVMGGHLSGDSDNLRPLYLEKAVELGEGLLKDKARMTSGEARFEVLNGLGIAYMRKGAVAADSSRQEFWTTAESRFKEALELRPTSVRAMQNMGLLRGMQAFQARSDGAEAQAQALFREAKDGYAKSLDLNPNDQYPHYRMAKLCALTDDWDGAERYFASGRQYSGAVAEEEWRELRAAIDTRDASALTW